MRLVTVELGPEARLRCDANDNASVVAATWKGPSTGFVDTMRSMVDGLAVSAGRVSYAVFDLGDAANDADTDGFDDLLRATRDLVSVAPVVTVAAVRGDCRGRSLELALCANVVLAQADCVMSFRGDRASLALRNLLGDAARDPLRAGSLDALAARDAGLVAAVYPDVGTGALDWVASALARHLPALFVHRAMRVAELAAQA